MLCCALLFSTDWISALLSSGARCGGAFLDLEVCGLLSKDLERRVFFAELLGRSSFVWDRNNLGDSPGALAASEPAGGALGATG